MNQALLSKQATEWNTPFPYGTIHAEIPGSSPAAVAIGSVQEKIAEEDLAGRGLDVGPTTTRTFVTCAEGQPELKVVSRYLAQTLICGG